MMNRGKKWTEEEERKMLQCLEWGSTISDCAQQQGRSVKALYLRLGSILQTREQEVRERHPRLPQNIMQRAVEMWEENEKNPSSPNPTWSGGEGGGGGSGNANSIQTSLEDMKRALEEIRVDIRKLRVQVKRLSASKTDA